MSRSAIEMADPSKVSSILSDHLQMNDQQPLPAAANTAKQTAVGASTESLERNCTFRMSNN